jgi:hypothetical protein
MIEHSPECKTREKKTREVYAAYVAKWPHYCRRCNGYGGFTVIENGAPHGAGFWPMEVYDACSCVQYGRCPRCGVEVWHEDDYDGDFLFCPECGWDEEHPDHAPDEHAECYCDSIRLDAWYDDYQVSC